MNLLRRARLTIRLEVGPDAVNRDCLNHFGERCIRLFLGIDFEHYRSAGGRDCIRKVGIASLKGGVYRPASRIEKFIFAAAGFDGRYLFAAAKQSHTLKSVLKVQFCPADS